MADNRLPNIDKLQGSNWPIWKMQITNYLVARYLWDLCDGTEVAPMLGAQEGAPAFLTRVKEHKKQVACMMSILGQTIATQHMYLIASVEVTTPQMAWTALHEHFEHPSLSNKMTLKAQLFWFQMKPGNSIEAHLKELNELVKKLAALDAPVPERIR